MNETITPEEYQKMIMEQCPFCKIAAGAIPAKKVYEDSKVIAFLDINPASPGHTLVIPKKHYTVFPQMSDADTAHIYKVVKNLSGILFELTQRSVADKPAGVNIVQNNGAAAGQQVPHVHIHVIPRVEGDGVIQPWTPKQVEEEQLSQMQAAISAAMQQVPVSTPEPQPAIPVPAPQPAMPVSAPAPQPVMREAPKPVEKEKPAKLPTRKPVSP